MGGSIGLTSEEGVGTTVWVTLLVVLHLFQSCTRKRQSTTSIPNPVSNPSNP